MNNNDVNEKLKQALNKAMADDMAELESQSASSPHNISLKTEPAAYVVPKKRSKLIKFVRPACAAAAAFVIFAGGLAAGVLTGSSSGIYRSGQSVSSDYDEAYTELMMDNPMPLSKSRSAVTGETSDSGLNVSENSLKAADTQRKLITTWYISAESTDFDNDTKALEEKLSSLGGYIESSSLNSDDPAERSIRYTFRVPSDKAESFTAAASAALNILSQSTQTDDVSLKYYDNESRISALRTELDSLNALMKKADAMSDIIEIASRISDINYQLDSYETTLRHLDSQINYTSVYLNIDEVKAATITPEKGIGERISLGFLNSVRSFTSIVVDTFVWIVSNIIFIAAAAVIIFVAVTVIKKLRHRK